jgi:hypothetical protein
MTHGGNMKKLKFKENIEMYRLLLTEEEMVLVNALVSRCRLGDDGDSFKEAAYQLNAAFEEEFGTHCFGEDDIEVGATITQNPDGSIDTTFEVSERDW